MCVQKKPFPFLYDTSYAAFAAFMEKCIEARVATEIPSAAVVDDNELDMLVQEPEQEQEQKQEQESASELDMLVQEHAQEQGQVQAQEQESASGLALDSILNELLSLPDEQTPEPRGQIRGRPVASPIADPVRRVLRMETEDASPRSPRRSSFEDKLTAFILTLQGACAAFLS